MKQQSLRWRFVNQMNPAETVLVHDQASAQTLAALLQKMGGEWMMQEERPLGALAQQAAAPAPQAKAPVQEQPAAVHAAATESVEDEHHEEDLAIEEESAEDAHAEEPSMAQAVIEAVVTAAHQESKGAVPPPAPKKPEKRERRATQRFMTEFRVILISGSSSFRTMSQDVSLGGMRLKKTIPESFMKEKCIAYVSHKDLRENIEIVCHVIGDPKDPCRIKFLQPNQTQLQRLNDWLMEHNQGVVNRGKAS